MKNRRAADRDPGRRARPAAAPGAMDGHRRVRLLRRGARDDPRHHGVPQPRPALRGRLLGRGLGSRRRTTWWRRISSTSTRTRPRTAGRRRRELVPRSSPSTPWPAPPRLTTFDRFSQMLLRTGPAGRLGGARSSLALQDEFPEQDHPRRTCGQVLATPRPRPDAPAARELLDAALSWGIVDMIAHSGRGRRPRGRSSCDGSGRPAAVGGDPLRSRW